MGLGRGHFSWDFPCGGWGRNILFLFVCFSLTFWVTSRQNSDGFINWICRRTISCLYITHSDYSYFPISLAQASNLLPTMGAFPNLGSFVCFNQDCLNGSGYGIIKWGFGELTRSRTLEDKTSPFPEFYQWPVLHQEGANPCDLPFQGLAVRRSSLTQASTINCRDCEFMVPLVRTQ